MSKYLIFRMTSFEDSPNLLWTDCFLHKSVLQICQLRVLVYSALLIILLHATHTAELCIFFTTWTSRLISIVSKPIEFIFWLMTMLSKNVCLKTNVRKNLVKIIFWSKILWKICWSLNDYVKKRESKILMESISLITRRQIIWSRLDLQEKCNTFQPLK